MRDRGGWERERDRERGRERGRAHLRRFSVQNVDLVAPTRYVEDGRIVEELRKLLCIEGGGGDDDLDVGPEARNVLDKAEEHVRVQSALMRLIYHHDLPHDHRSVAAWTVRATSYHPVKH